MTRTPRNSETGRQLQAIEDAKADTLDFAIKYLRQEGHEEAAAVLENLWDQPPQPTKETAK